MTHDAPKISPHLRLGKGAEFDAVRDLLSQWVGVASGIGDDAAVLDVPAGTRLVVSTDTSAEDVHFKRAWLTPDEIGWRAAQSALSDLAAMGAAPLGLLVAIGVPPLWRVDLRAIAAGIGAAALSVGAPIVGGDVTNSDRLTFGITVLGYGKKPLSRAGARAGDTLFVTGALGGPGAAVAAWERGGVPQTEHRARFARPQARVAEGIWLAANDAHAAIDISDGLAGEAAHVAAASGVRCILEVASVPCVPGVSALDALSSGEEYELLVAAAPADVGAFIAAFSAANEGLALTAVGRVEASRRISGEVVAVRDGITVPLSGAHDHFAVR